MNQLWISHSHQVVSILWPWSRPEGCQGRNDSFEYGTRNRLSQCTSKSSLNKDIQVREVVVIEAIIKARTTSTIFKPEVPMGINTVKEARCMLGQAVATEDWG